MFEKDISRNIQGVINADQDSENIIRIELDEYVITKELNAHFSKFFENYQKGLNSNTEKMGVWISGFFGSGKSHFLKILSYILSGKMYGGQVAVDYFEDKIKDQIVYANMKKASEVSTDVILFNIEAKDFDSNSNKDSIVKVFMKVFNEYRGFYGNSPWIAELEQRLTGDGTYDSFKSSYFKISGRTWEDGRVDYHFEGDTIIQALTESMAMSLEIAQNWFYNTENTYSLSIEQFSKKVHEYIKQKGKSHHVVFLCDEIGQYIGDDSKLMLNLQTVVENLGAECKGKAWVIATSQQDIDSHTKSNRDNFSKIIGRFDTRLSLSSSNVDEVIKKRLLLKNETATDKLKLLYADKNAIIKNLITFSQDATEKKLYSNEGEFTDVYPFIPYHFNLLQEVFTGVRKHGASGKHLSEGERSLLNAFQESVLEFKNSEEGVLVPFDTFYKTIISFLDHDIQIVINNASKNNKLDSFDVRVLKVLFLIKYTQDSIPANLENLSTLMVSNIDDDKIKLKKDIDAALRKLESEKLISKNGNQFSFLTNEEQDINREILDISVDEGEIIDQISSEMLSLLFGLNRKYSYKGYDFPSNFSVDGRSLGTQREEIGVSIFTPYSADDISEQALKSRSAKENNAIMMLPDNISFMEEIRQALQIDIYIKKTSDKVASDTIKSIKSNKIMEAESRRERSRSLIDDALKSATIYVNGNKLNISEKAPKERMSEALNTLIEGIYTKLNYITTSFYKQEDLKKILTLKEDQAGLNDKQLNFLAVEEMRLFISKSSEKHISLSMKALLDHFKKAPYGWKDLDVASVLLILFKEQSIRLEMSGDNVLIDNSRLLDYLTKRDHLDRLLIKSRVNIDSRLLLETKKLSQELFEISAIPNDEEGMMKEFKELATKERNNIADLLGSYQNKSTYPYPGKEILENYKSQMDLISQIKENLEFYNHLKNESENILDSKDSVSDVKKFFNNQKSIFDKSVEALEVYEANRSFIGDESIQESITRIKGIVESSAPYSNIRLLPELYDSFYSRFEETRQLECVPVRENVEFNLNTVLENASKYGLSDKFDEKAEAEFNSIFEKLDKAKNIPEIISGKEESDRLMNKFIDQILEEYEKVNRLGQTDSSNPDETGAVVKDPKPVTKMKRVRFNALISGSVQISNREDIEKLLVELKRKLETELEEDMTLTLI